MTIFKNMYFDFFYEDDFVKIIEYYCMHYKDQNSLHKTVNVGYEQKYTLYEIAKQILPEEKINVIELESLNYCGNTHLLKQMNIEFLGLETGLKKMENILLLSI